MKNSQKALVAGAVLLIAAAVVFAASQFALLRQAHSTFDNYYAFRDCEKLIDRTPTYGDCQLASGQIIRIVNFRGRWYLDGDLPACWANMCL
jgi:hypothetical protein